MATVSLRIVRGKAQRKKRLVHSPVFMIGAGCDCDLVLADSRIPELHSYLFVRDEGVSIRRMAEAPELHVNGIACEGSDLKTNDLIQINTFVFAVEIAADAKASRLVGFPVFDPSACDPMDEIRALIRDVRESLKEEAQWRLVLGDEPGADRESSFVPAPHWGVRATSQV